MIWEGMSIHLEGDLCWYHQPVIVGQIPTFRQDAFLTHFAHSHPYVWIPWKPPKVRGSVPQDTRVVSRLTELRLVRLFVQRNSRNPRGCETVFFFESKHLTSNWYHSVSMTLGVSMLDAKNQCRVRRKKSQTEDFNRLEQHLSLCKRPVAGAGDRKWWDGSWWSVAGIPIQASI